MVARHLNWEDSVCAFDLHAIRRYLQAVVELIHHMLRMLERFAASKKYMFVRKSRKGRKTKESKGKMLRYVYSSSHSGVYPYVFKINRKRRKLTQRLKTARRKKRMRRNKIANERIESTSSNSSPLNR